LIPPFLALEFPESANDKLMTEIIKAFRGIGFLNVWLDDLLDEEEDSLNGDVNLVTDILAGKYDASLKSISSIEILNFSKDRIELLNEKVLVQIIDDFAVSTTKENRRLITSLLKIITNMPKLYYYMGVQKGAPEKRLRVLKQISEKATQLYNEHIQATVT